MARVKRMWVPLVMVLVIAIASFAVVRLHGVFGRQPASVGGANGVDTLVQFNPKHVLYDVWGPAGSAVQVDYLDEHAQPQRVATATVPWSYEIVTTDTAVIASVVFVFTQLPTGSTTEQTWQFLGAAINTYCPEQAPALHRAAGQG
jgi:Mycobacterium membrane protein